MHILGICKAYLASIFFKKCFSIGVLEIEKTKKRQSHQISAKILILNAPPMSDVHTKNQRPSSKNGLGRAYPRPWFLLEGGNMSQTLDLNRGQGQ